MVPRVATVLQMPDSGAKIAVYYTIRRLVIPPLIYTLFMYFPEHS